MSTPAATSENFQAARGTFENLYLELTQSVYLSQEHALQILGTMAIGGHLMEAGVFGIGKTAIAKALAASVGGEASRISGDSDKMPSDIIGTPIWNPDTKGYEFLPGPIFANVVLADELHRVPERSQSGLIEAMAEKQVTVLGETHEMPKPHLVIATINEDGQEVTKVIQDRFIGALRLPMQTADIRAKVLAVKQAGHETQVAATPNEVLNLQSVVGQTSTDIRIDPDLEHTANTLIDRVYEDREVDHEESIEGSFRVFENILDFSRFVALASGSNGSRMVRAKHVAFAVPFVLGHRVVPTYEAQSRGVTSQEIIRRTMANHLRDEPTAS